MSMGGGGGQQVAPQVFLPPGRDQVAAALGNLTQPFQSQQQATLGIVDQFGAPGGLAYPGIVSAAQNIYNNPYYNQALQGAVGANQLFNQYVLPNATTGAAALQGFAPGIQGAATNPAYAQAGGIAGQTSPQLAGMASTIANQSFDPQGALFNRLQQQQLNQSTVANAMAGLGASPYGASTTANALGNLDINWQNALLNRMTQGGQAAGALDQAAIQNLLTPANSALNAQLAGMQGVGQAYTGAQNLLTPAVSGYAQYAGLPATTYGDIGQSQLGAMQNLTNLGNTAAYSMPQQLINDYMTYINAGTNASNAAANAAQVNNAIGQTNFSQLAGGLGGAQQLLFGNSLANQGGLLGGLGGSGGGLFSAGGLLGSQGPLFGTAADASIAAGGPPLALAAPAFSV